MAHAGPYDDPYDLAGEVRFLPAPSNGGPLGCLNVGIESARADVVHLMWPGVLASEGWVEPALEVLAATEVAAVSPLVVSEPDPQRVLAAGVRWRVGGMRGVLPSRPRAMGDWLNKLRMAAPTKLAGFYRREALLALGRLDGTAGAEMADAELSVRMRAVGLACRVAPESRVLADESLLATPASFSRGRMAERMFWRTAGEMGWAGSLAVHPAAVLTEWVKNVHRPGGWLQLMGRAVGMLELGDHRAYREKLTKLRVRDADEGAEIHSLPAAEEPSQMKRAA